jgi:hypothetical protein
LDPPKKYKTLHPYRDAPWSKPGRVLDKPGPVLNQVQLADRVAFFAKFSDAGVDAGA